MTRQQGAEGQDAPPLDEQNLQTLVETIPALVWRARPDGHIDYVNKRLLDYLGSPVEEIIGWGWMKKVHPHDVAFKVQSWLKHLEATSSHDTNCRFEGADGVYRWFNVRGEPLRDSDGRVLNWYGVLIDIDQQKKAEQTSRESEIKLREIIETIPSMLWSTAPDGQPTHINQRILDYSGLRLENFLNLGWKEFVHPEDFTETARAFFQAIQTGEPYEAVHRLRRADGQYRWHHARGEPLRDREGRIVQWYGLSIDIDERKRAEDRLRRSEGYLADAQRLSHAGTLVLDATTWQYVYLSDESYRIWGLDPLQGLPSHDTIRQRFHPDDRDSVWRKVQEALRQRKDYSGEFRILLPDGTIKYLAVTAHHLFSTTGELLEVIATSIDVTDQKRGEQALRESGLELRATQAQLARASQAATVAELSASIAHEINQPLAGIVASAETCRTWLSGDNHNLPRARAALQRIIRDGNAAADIIRRIRALFRQTPPAKISLHINEIIHEVRHLAQDELNNKGVSIETDLTQNMPTAYFDRIQIQQVLMNLIRNGAEAMEDANGNDKRLIVRSQRTDRHIVVEVCDHGPGLTHPEKVFEPFFTTKQNGLGVGLAISRSIAQAHGGALLVRDNQPQGTVFSLTLPLRSEAGDDAKI